MAVKQVIVCRKDLNMRKGKMVAQGSHASLAAFLNEGSYTTEKGKNGKTTFECTLDDDLKEWLITGGFTKICVCCGSEEELLALYSKAQEAGMPRSLITDSGKTEFGGVPTKTCIAIGPAKAEEIDKITGHLQLL